MIGLAFRSLSRFSRRLAALHLCTSTAPSEQLRRGGLIEWKDGLMPPFWRKELVRVAEFTPKYLQPSRTREPHRSAIVVVSEIKTARERKRSRR
jgi:hypothetical protein